MISSEQKKAEMEQKKAEIDKLDFFERRLHGLLESTQPAYKDLADTCGPRSALVIARECPRLTDLLKSAQNVTATDQTRAVTDTFGKALYGRPDQARAIDKQLEQNPALARNFLDLYEHNPVALQKALPEIIGNPDRMPAIVASISTKPVTPAVAQQRPASAMTVSMPVASNEPAAMEYFSDVVARHPELKLNIETELKGKPELNRQIADLAQKNPEALDAAKKFYVEKSFGYADVRERMQKVRLDRIVDKAVKEPDYFPNLMSRPPTAVTTPPALAAGPTPATAQPSPAPATPAPPSGKADLMTEMEKLSKQDPALADKAFKFATEVGMVGDRFRPGFEEFGQRVFKSPEMKNALITAIKGDNGGKVTEELKKNLKEHPDLFERMNEVIDRNPRAAKKMFSQIADGNIAGGIETFSSTVRMNAIVDGIADFLGMISPALGEKFRSFADGLRNSKYGEMADGFIGKMINKAAGDPEPEKEKKENTPAPSTPAPAPAVTTSAPPPAAASATPMLTTAAPGTSDPGAGSAPLKIPEKLFVKEEPWKPVYRDPTPEERRRWEDFTDNPGLPIRDRIGERSGLSSPVEGGLTAAYNVESQGRAPATAPEPDIAPAIRQNDVFKKQDYSIV